MEFLGIGPLELLFILVIILLVVGPKDLDKTARTLGKTLNSIVKSDNYRMIQRASQELRNLPTELMREANLEDSLKEGQEVLKTAQTMLEGSTRSVDDQIRQSWSSQTGTGNAAGTSAAPAPQSDPPLPPPAP